MGPSVRQCEFPQNEIEAKINLLSISLIKKLEDVIIY
jgi:hypothetical protein